MDIPTPSRRQLLFAGGAAALGLAGIIEAPLAAVLAGAPLIYNAVKAFPDEESPSRSSSTRSASGRRRSSRSTSSGTGSPRRRGAASGRRRGSSAAPTPPRE